MGILDLMNGIEAAGDRGRARGQQTRLGQLYAGAMQAPREQRGGYLAEMAKVSPDAATGASGHFDKLDDSGRKQLGQYAAAFAALPADQKAAAYPQFADMGRAAGLPVPQGEYRPEFDAGIQQIGQAFGAAQGIPAQQQYAEWLLKNAPEDQRGQVMGVLGGYKARPSGAAIQYKDGEDENGNPIIRAFDPNNVGGQVMGTGQTYGAPVGTGSRGPQASAQPRMPGGDMFASLPPNLQVTSGQRSPEHNREVGGVANSYHLTNQARDVVPRSPQESAQVRQWAAQNNMEVVDEGDHLHLEPRGNAPRNNQAGGFTGRRKEDEAAAVTDAQERTKLGYLPATEQIKADAAIRQSTGVAQAGADVERRSAGIKKAPQLLNVERGITRIRSAIDGLKGSMVDTGPLDKYLVGPTKSGQELTAAVGAIKNDMLALTRVPGVGSQSDLEQKIGDLKYPDIGNHPEVNAKNLEQLQAFIRDLETSLMGNAKRPQKPASGGWSIQKVGQ